MKTIIGALTVAAIALGFAAGGLAADSEAKKEAKKPALKQCTGIVESCDATSIKVKAVKGGDIRTFVVDAKTRVSTADKKEAAITDIKCGDKVVVFYAEQDGKEIARRIAPPAPPKKKEEKK
ncbi:MAG: hypothetical protein N3B01_05750 [Verrucomicrobiae bacterium]|nr:hypothetical protein [Verrucomicrobiae bacterium]